MSKARILIVEDEASMRRILRRLLEGAGHEVHEAECLATAKDKFAGEPLDLVITDYRLKSGSGMEVLAAAVEFDPTLPVIMVTAYATVDLAVGAMKEGMFDFITKPFVPDTVLASVTRACRHARLLRENARLKEEVLRLEFGETVFLGESQIMQTLRETIARVAPTDATALITGETGTGKELVARLIHANSLRKASPFVVVNCAAIPETLLESHLFGHEKGAFTGALTQRIGRFERAHKGTLFLDEVGDMPLDLQPKLLESHLFGHEKGAFTGADRARQGVFEAADGGTLFLDEAGEMPLSLQAKLLRVLMDGELHRVGSTTARHVDVRILAATHRDLRARVKEGLFREDLYYRLAVVPVHVPPLRSRREDLPALTRHFLNQVVEQLKAPRRTVSEQAIRQLERYDFPGNVRELRNLIERACILCRGDEITAADFPLEGVAEPESGAAVDALPENLSLRDTLEHVEVLMLRRALEESGGNQAKAARRLAISRSDMSYKLKKYGLRGDTDVAEDETA